MISTWELTNATARLVLPPGVLILLGLIGLCLIRASPRLGRALALFALIALYVLATPIASRTLVRAIEVPYADPTLDRRGGAIVVLGGGSYVRAPEYHHDTVGRASLERVRYGAYLHRALRRPLLVTSGNPMGADTTEGAQMQAALREFGVSAMWIEEGSNNTLENARLTRRLLNASGIRTIYLVTHAWHMQRARMAFEGVGFTVIPAPLGYKTTLRLMLLDFIPTAEALSDSGIFFHETAGLAWYRLKFALAR